MTTHATFCDKGTRMISLPLLRLMADDFTDSIGVVLPTVPLRQVLQRSNDVRRLLAAVRFRQVTATDVREFVSQLLKDFRSGEVFQHDIVLAALAVVMEHWNEPFAAEYLVDLARIKHPEFRASSRMARECLKARKAFPTTQVRTSVYPKRSVAPSTTARRIRKMRPTKLITRGANAFPRSRYPEASYAHN